MTPRVVVYVDVDDTLVRSFGSKRIPMSAMVEHVRALHRSGALLYCWSSGGSEYAESSARELGIAGCFTGYLPKPNVAIDDAQLEQWPRLLWVHPNEATSKVASDYEAALDAPKNRTDKPRDTPPRGEPDGDVAFLRELLEAHDTGILTEGEVASRVFRREIEGLVAALRTGESLMTISSHCGGPLPPPEKVRVEIEIDAQNIEIRSLPPAEKSPGAADLQRASRGVSNRAHLIFYVRDQAASARFYRAVLACAPTLDVPGMTEFEVAPGAILGLMPEDGIKRLLGDSIDPGQAGGTPRAELYLLVDDPGAHHARALSSGARELSPLEPRNWGHEAAYCADPDGHVLAFARALPPTERWPRASQRRAPRRAIAPRQHTGPQLFNGL